MTEVYIASAGLLSKKTLDSVFYALKKKNVQAVFTDSEIKYELGFGFDMDVIVMKNYEHIFLSYVIFGSDPQLERGCYKPLFAYVANKISAVKYDRIGLILFKLNSKPFEDFFNNRGFKINFLC